MQKLLSLVHKNKFSAEETTMRKVIKTFVLIPTENVSVNHSNRGAENICIYQKSSIALFFSFETN